MVTLSSHYQSPARTNAGLIACTSLAVDGVVSPAQFANEVDTVELQVQTDAVRYTTDGTSPTASVGILLAVNTREVWSRAKFNQAKFIKVTNAAVVYACPLQIG